jgi:GT2 family glycosyltransferase
MKVSIVILNYNTFELTCNCIRSVKKHTEGIRYEIVLIDNGSSERNPNEFAQLFPDIKLVLSEKNLGFSAGNNLGIKSCEGEYILLLNSDTEIQENSIARSVEVLESRKQTAVLSCKLIFPDGQVQKQCGRFPSVWREFLMTTRLIRLIPGTIKANYFQSNWFDHEQSREADFLWGAFFLFRKQELAYFPEKKLPETYFMYYEDVEWCYLLKQADRGIYYFADTTIIHHLGKSSSGRNLKAMFTNEKDFIIRFHGKGYWNRWKFWRVLNYRLSKRKHPEMEAYLEVLKQV